MNYSNPRTEAVIADWPSGAHRTTATFRIECDPKRGERATRTTVDPRSGRESKPKVTTYAAKARIVDGDDGRTYIVNLTRHSGHISIMQGNLQFQQEAVFPDDDSRYAALLALFD